MARRTRKSSWSTSLQRTLGALTRATLNAGSRAMVEATKQAAKQAVRQARKTTVVRRVRRAEAPRAALTGIALGPAGARRYHLYKPKGARKNAPLPLLVMLHGCDQDAASFARSTRLPGLAARAGFFVLFVEQDRIANPQACWNWYDTHSGRAFGEAALIVAAIDQVCALHAIDRTRVAVAGLSAGASMAAWLGVRYPERFKAVAMHSGVAAGAAQSAATALRAMRGQGRLSPLTEGLVLPPLLVIHGSADSVVAPRNALITAQWWAAASGAKPAAERLLQRGRRHAMVVTDFRRSRRVVASLCEIAGLGHAWSGGAAGQPYSDPQGPDATRMILAFAQRAFTARV
jgi:poly(hydroxyalkanoate) depolymerase family esterase